MLKHILLGCSVILFFSCKGQKKEENLVAKAEKSSVKVVDFESLTPYLEAKDDKTYVVNFWATWCAPCVKELPYFQELDSQFSDDQLSLLFVSLDFPDKVESKLIPFIEKRGMKEKVVLLDDSNENEWIPKIDENWSGALPATLIFNKDKRVFYEQSFTKEQLFNEVEKFTKTKI